MRYIKHQILILCLIFISCGNENVNTSSDSNENDEFVTAVDISAYPEISSTNPSFYDLNDNEKDFLEILKESGVNTIRLKLWVNPANKHSGFNEVKQFSQTLKANGFKSWLTLHYSDTWADPGRQETPSSWRNLDFSTLKDSLRLYTKKVVQDIKPDYIQIGNEINSGLLHPYGDISTNASNFISLIEAGCSAVRENSENCKIILHFAGIENSDWFLNQVSTVDYDILGLSYYPIWHGKSITSLNNTMKNLSNLHNKQILIAETAYPFTLQWKDLTNNILGLEEQLILPEYPASAEGQRKFIKDIKSIIQELDKGIGFCYWGAELIAWKGDEATDGSPWENQALFDFNNKALPVLNEFKIE